MMAINFGAHGGFVSTVSYLLFPQVWRKRWITLRYHSKSSPSVLQIESRNCSSTAPANNSVPPSSVPLLLTLTPTTSVEIVDSSAGGGGPGSGSSGSGAAGAQDLAGAKVLQLQLDEHSEPVIFKHASLDEMSDWIAAFRLTVALGELNGSICSDTDNSSSWAGSQAAPSPVSSESPIRTTFTFGKSAKDYSVF